jgi:hypothetical protein
MQPQENAMSFQISGLEPGPFSHLFNRSDAELAQQGVQRYTVTEKPGSPCRVSLQDAEPGETLLLLNYTHLDVATPYRASHAIFVGENALPAELAVDEVPDSIRCRLMSVRAFDSVGMMCDADVVEGTALESVVQRLFADPAVAYLHLHNAKRGCYAARVDSRL